MELNPEVSCPSSAFSRPPAEEADADSLAQSASAPTALSLSLSHCHRVQCGKNLEDHKETPVEKEETNEKSEPRN